MLGGMIKYLAILAIAVAAPAAAQNAQAGAAAFNQTCKMCHAVTAGQKVPLGPNLLGVFGRKAGSAEFAYSDAMKKSGLTWNDATLDKYLTAPMKMVPGSKMPIGLSDAKKRADVIAYLKSLRR